MGKMRIWNPFRRILCAILCITAPLDSYAKTIRKIEAESDQVIGVRTALGYSTIIDFPSKPISAVLGDQDAFKLEYVGNSITVKPLVPRATSNLFIFTESDRFNCTLRTGNPAEVDYLVKVSSSRRSYPIESVPSSQTPSGETRPLVIHSRRISKTALFAGYSLQIKSMSVQKSSDPSRSVTLIDFEISSKRGSYAFSPHSLGIKQKAQFIPMESIYLDALELNPRSPPIHGKMALLNQDFDPFKPFSLVFAVPAQRSSSKTHRIEISIAPPDRSKKPIQKGS